MSFVLQTTVQQLVYVIYIDLCTNRWGGGGWGVGRQSGGGLDTGNNGYASIIHFIGLDI